MAGSLVGKTLLKRFYVEAFIDSGGMSTIYKVLDLHRNVPLALKTMHSDMIDDPAIFRQFQREAKSLEALKHPNIVRYYGLYQSNDNVFLIESFIDGFPLTKLISTYPRKLLPVKTSLVILKVVSNALNYAHNLGFIHCDIKPGNVLIENTGRIFLADFGIARHINSTSTTLASAGAPAYMAPEQILAKAVSPATDIYATGIMMYELFCGRRPFSGTETGIESGVATTSERLRTAHLQIKPPDPRQFNPAIPEKLALVLLRALEKDARKRYQSMDQFYSAVIAAAGFLDTNIPNEIQIPKILASAHSVQNSHGNFLSKGTDFQPEPEMKKELIPHHTSISLNLIIIAIAIIGTFFFFSMLGGKKISSDSTTIAFPASIPNNQPNPTNSTISNIKVATKQPSPTKTPQSKKCWAESTDNNINIRSGPGGGIIGCCLAKGEDVEIFSIDGSGKWALIEGIEKPAHKGWVSVRYLNISGDCQMVETIP